MKAAPDLPEKVPVDFPNPCAKKRKKDLKQSSCLHFTWHLSLPYISPLVLRRENFASGRAIVTKKIPV